MGSAQRWVLNVGSGPAGRSKLHTAFHRREWTEVRLDIEPRVEPDIIGSMVSMPQIKDGTFDAIWSSHNIEHLHAHEVPLAMGEFRRVLRGNGFALITCPDVAAIAKLVVEGRLEDVAYVSPAGPITALDMLFGHSASIAAGQIHMAHNTGFTLKRLADRLVAAGFREVRAMKGPSYDLWVVALAGTMELAASCLEGTGQAALLRDPTEAAPRELTA
ncbi:methyltransferase domain-containing protein [Xanthobacter sp. DSM 24535]|uniref:class I SAM-dependent methyltransferase n=1 Tax=Roseixanthobacter psychrophilus TaxID=3119917 RepID=UPI003726B2C4